MVKVSHIVTNNKNRCNLLQDLIEHVNMNLFTVSCTYWFLHKKK